MRTIIVTDPCYRDIVINMIATMFAEYCDIPFS